MSVVSVVQRNDGRSQSFSGDDSGSGSDYDLSNMKYNWDKNKFVYSYGGEVKVPDYLEVVWEKDKWNVYDVSNPNKKKLRGTISEKEPIPWKSRWRSMSSVFAMVGASAGVIGGVSVDQKLSGGASFAFWEGFAFSRNWYL